VRFDFQLLRHERRGEQEGEQGQTPHATSVASRAADQAAAGSPLNLCCLLNGKLCLHGGQHETGSE
jgi:hypothetical protein